MPGSVLHTSTDGLVSLPGALEGAGAYILKVWNEESEVHPWQEGKNAGPKPIHTSPEFSPFC